MKQLSFSQNQLCPFSILFCLFIFISVLFGFSKTLRAEQKLTSAEKSIWKIQSNSGEGTGFFIGENYFITNFHVAVPVFLAGLLESLTLLQEGKASKLKVKKVLALSALHDLALVETEGKVTNYLSIKESSPELEENLFLPAYPKGIFKRMKKTGNIFYEDDFIYSFPGSHFDFHGASGGPVLDEKGEIAGVLFSGIENIVDVVKTTPLKEFILSDTGLDCSEYINIRDCIKKEIENLKKLAEKGSPLAQFRLSFLYYEGGRAEGWKSEQNLHLVLKWSEKAARQGYVPAQNSLATRYYYAGKKSNSWRARKYFKLALRWYTKAAEQGHLLAQYGLALMYHNGEGVRKDFKLALKWLTKAAKGGYASAQHNLAAMYSDGRGVEPNQNLAFEWCKKAAEQGHAPAQHNLAIMYLKGNGVGEDLSLSFKWYKRSAEQGYAPAQFSLAAMYLNGKGTDRNIELALKWLTEAASQNHPQAGKMLSLLGCANSFSEGT